MSYIFGNVNATLRPTRYLFIDGAYLRCVVERLSTQFWPNENLEINYATLASGFHKSFYYDCMPPKQKNELEEVFNQRHTDQQQFFQRLGLIRGFHVNTGSLRGEGGRQRQKQVDTMMAVDMLTHSYRKNASDITLLAGDLDFKPIVDALVPRQISFSGSYPRLFRAFVLLNRH